MTDQKKGAGAPEGNKNAEQWPLDKAVKLFEKCLKIAMHKTNEENDFIGEVAMAADSYLNQLDYLRKKYPKELQPIYDNIKSCCEANCFRNGKTGKIIPSLAIMNLKSNHGWTDRVETKSENVNVNVQVSKEEAKKISKHLEDEF